MVVPAFAANQTIKGAPEGKNLFSPPGPLGKLLPPMNRTRTTTTPERGAFREVPYMGVIFVVAEASKLGFVNGHPDWCNLGQGQPEVGPMEGAPPRLDTVTIRPEDHAYGPLGGIPELRAAVAAHYNRLYRKGRRSRYTADHVCVAMGGRLALTRALAALGNVSVGYQLPDYTAYEDMFNLHLGRLHPVPLRTTEAHGFSPTPEEFEREVAGKGLGAFLISNPCNPTGNVIAGRELARWVEIARRRRVTLLLDEFYSHFIYTKDGRPGAGPVSAAAYVEDVDRDPVVLFDGLTKSFRYPGWRVGWAVGPAAMMESLARVASSVDGGPSRIAQRMALQALEPEQADRETRALREVFAGKRNLMVRRLSAMGIRCAAEPRGTFYCWASLEGLKPPFDDAMTFFRRALERKVMTVPGSFFDVNPGGWRREPSPYRQWMRFSFGPPRDNVAMGLDRLAKMLGRRKGVRSLFGRG
jgi:aspartate/methionine/tyrosine aminotransferase